MNFSIDIDLITFISVPSLSTNVPLIKVRSWHLQLKASITDFKLTYLYHYINLININLH